MCEENKLLLDRNVLVYDDYVVENYYREFEYVRTNFCGTVCHLKDFEDNDNKKLVYMCGNIERFNLNGNYVIKELSVNYDGYTLLTLKEMPINMYNVGVFFERFFGDEDYFGLIESSHEFQQLTAYNNPFDAYRTGIYLTNVNREDDTTNFNLLRCSTNFTGPTDNFRDVDKQVINKVNDVQQYFFEQPVELNHVLAQIYNNKNNKKAKISEHSDKTKDMPRNAIMAFCTFYKQDNNLVDYNYKGETKLTRLRFRLKPDVEDTNLVKEFDVLLYPNSLFLMSLETNRMYTHAIVPSGLDNRFLPTRMGYVIRCSNTKAFYRDGKTFIDNGERCVELRESTDEDMKEIKSLYRQENLTTDKVEYKDIFYSMNKGDYMEPLV